MNALATRPTTARKGEHLSCPSAEEEVNQMGVSIEWNVQECSTGKSYNMADLKNVLGQSSRHKHHFGTGGSRGSC